MKVSSDNVLAKTAVQAVMDAFSDRLVSTFLMTHVDFQLDVVNSELVVTAREVSLDGEYGLYSGTERLSYQKASLQAVVPEALVVKMPWPATYQQLTRYLLDNYNVVLEEGELAVVGTGGIALTSGSVITATPELTTGLVEFEALPQSGRWIAGSRLRLQVIPLEGPWRLATLLPNEASGALEKIIYP